ncbi:MAG: hypothetical protein JW751_29685 [Polyangiaceae bacterium]|nr:hypothetical protein [Polyangiaceae bacterium]
MAGCRRDRRVLPDKVRPDHLRGDRVVVEVHAGEFVEGTVTANDGGRLRVQATVGGEILDLGEGDALRPGEGGTKISEGAYAVCGIGEARWVACRVVSIDGDQAAIALAGDAPQRIPSRRVVVPGELTRLNIERHFGRTEARAAYRQALRVAGPPPIDSAWRPRPEERLIVRRGEEWVSARVAELERERVLVRCVGEDRAVEFPYADVRPAPPYPVAPWTGGFVLVRPAAEARPWEAMRVASFAEDEAAVVVDEHGDRSTRALRDLVPLGLPPAPSAN